MYAETWRPGTNAELDNLFDEIREKFYRAQQHPLWENYNAKHFQSCEALTISFDNNNYPYLAASILKRSCWPPRAYRILNRFWSNKMSVGSIKNLPQEKGLLLKSQIQWLKDNTDSELHFISRSSKYWQKWSADQYEHNFGLGTFYYDNYKYLVCDNCADDSCWQTIVYQGNSELLKQWQKRL